MDDFRNRTVFVTGGAGGIGAAIARSLGRRGARIVLADIDGDAVARSAATLCDEGVEAAAAVCDVADAASVQRAADETVRRFGGVHVVVNNAGVSFAGGTGEIPLEDWRWIVDVNLMGVVHGVETFVPLIRAQGEGGYVVNLASIAGLWPVAGAGPYSATKAAVIAYSEAIRQDLEADAIGVSVVCPGWVKTGIHETRRLRPSRRGGTDEEPATGAMRLAEREIAAGIDAALVGEWVADSMAAGRFYIFTHPEMAGVISARARAMKIDYAACAEEPRFAAMDGE